MQLDVEVFVLDVLGHGFFAVVGEDVVDPVEEGEGQPVLVVFFLRGAVCVEEGGFVAFFAVVGAELVGFVEVLEDGYEWAVVTQLEISHLGGRSIYGSLRLITHLIPDHSPMNTTCRMCAKGSCS